MAKVFEIIYQKKHDRYVGIHYNKEGFIIGINYEVGPSTIEAIAKSDDNLMEILEGVVAELDCETTKKYIINKTIKRAEQIMLNLTKLKP